LIVRRVRTLNPQGELLPSWEVFPFVTNRTEPLALVEAEPRQHAVVELAIRDLKDQALAHFPSGRFAANAAWTVIAALAHNLLRWTGALGLEFPRFSGRLRTRACEARKDGVHRARDPTRVPTGVPPRGDPDAARRPDPEGALAEPRGVRADAAELAASGPGRYATDATTA
jgi:hypothetical protein